WSRASCARASACNVTPDPSCANTDDQLGASCLANRNGCLHPDPASFDRCRTKDETETCADYCAPGQQFCFHFCFFACLPNHVPDPMDTAGPDGDQQDAGAAGSQEAGADTTSTEPPADATTDT